MLLLKLTAFAVINQSILLKLTAFAVISQSILLKLTAFAVISRFFSNSGFHFQSWCNSQGPFWRTRADCFG